MKAIVTFRRLESYETYQIGDFHRLPNRKELFPVRSTVGGVVGEPRHLKTGREFYRVNMPLHVSAPIISSLMKEHERLLGQQRMRKMIMPLSLQY